ncbi:MAG: hypothetical protein KBT22_03330 [Bacteroidales bacterium]|nr:hypothetical protein [Candidatus Scybalocola fimicaballi]
MGIWEAIKGFFHDAWNAFKRILVAIIDFFTHIAGYFRDLLTRGEIQQGRDTPFIIENKKLKKMIHEAPEINAGIFQATYNEETEEVENVRAVEGQLDDKTKNALSKSKNGIVTLS